MGALIFIGIALIIIGLVITMSHSDGDSSDPTGGYITITGLVILIIVCIVFAIIKS